MEMAELVLAICRPYLKRSGDATFHVLPYLVGARYDPHWVLTSSRNHNRNREIG